MKVAEPASFKLPFSLEGVTVSDFADRRLKRLTAWLARGATRSVFFPSSLKDGFLAEPGGHRRAK